MLTLLALSAYLLAPPQSLPEPIEMLPGIRVAEGVVDFDATIAVDAHHPDTPDVYLEMFITAPDSREHESLILARIKPSNLHAALLAAGFENGAPYQLNEHKEPIMAHGDVLRILVAIVAPEDEEPLFIPLTDWAVHIESGESISSAPKWDGFVFAGSRLTARGYEADGAGTIASLTTFANEVIAPKWSVSHLADFEEPVWIASRELLPKKGEPVIIRIISADLEQDPSHEPERVDINSDP